MTWHIPFLPALFVAAILVGGCAAQPSPPAEPAVTIGRPAQLDDLFTRLRQTPDDNEAELIQLAILRSWASSGQGDIDALMLQALEMVHADDLDGAIVLMDEVVAQAPTFAEAYNQRATIHVMRDEYDGAIEDIRRVLALEPRHFGALAGLGRIYLMFDREQAALACFEAALAINPHLVLVRAEAAALREELAGVPI